MFCRFSDSLKSTFKVREGWIKLNTYGCFLINYWPSLEKENCRYSYFHLTLNANNYRVLNCLVTYSANRETLQGIRNLNENGYFKWAFSGEYQKISTFQHPRLWYLIEIADKTKYSDSRYETEGTWNIRGNGCLYWGLVCSSLFSFCSRSSSLHGLLCC